MKKNLLCHLAHEGVRDHPFSIRSEVTVFNGRVFLAPQAYKVGGGKYYKMGAIGKDVDILVAIEALSKQ